MNPLFPVQDELISELPLLIVLTAEVPQLFHDHSAIRISDLPAARLLPSTSGLGVNRSYVALEPRQQLYNVLIHVAVARCPVQLGRLSAPNW